MKLSSFTIKLWLVLDINEVWFRFLLEILFTFLLFRGISNLILALHPCLNGTIFRLHRLHRAIQKTQSKLNNKP